MDTERIQNEIKEILEKMTFVLTGDAIDVHQGATSRISVRVSADDIEDAEGKRISSINILIGERGGNLAALEHILKKILKKKYGEVAKFTLDINDYRIKRLEDLKQDIKDAAKEVRLYHREVSLRPMPSFERRITHLLLAEYPDIMTESVGEDPERRVIIKPYP